MMHSEMAEFSEIEKRKKALNDELYDSVEYSESKAVANHRFSLGFMAVALGCSLLAGVLGLSSAVDARVVGTLAILPPLIAYIAINLKFEEKSAWHYRKAIAMRGLKSRLMFQQPEVVTVDNISAIAKERDAVHSDMQKEWDQTLRLNWAGIAAARRPQPPPPED
jgi:hypothetical protein